MDESEGRAPIDPGYLARVDQLRRGVSERLTGEAVRACREVAEDAGEDPDERFALLAELYARLGPAHLATAARVISHISDEATRHEAHATIVADLVESGRSDTARGFLFSIPEDESREVAAAALEQAEKEHADFLRSLGRGMALNPNFLAR